MILATTIQSEKGKEIVKTANEFIFMELTVKKQKVGEIELYYFNDSVDDKMCIDDMPHRWDFGEKNPDSICLNCKEYKKDLCDEGEWLLKFRPCGNNQEEEDKPDWDIIAQGNI